MHGDLLLYALPVFVACMAAEWAWGRWRGRDTYGLADTLSSLSQGLLSQAVALVTPLIQAGLYAAVHARFALVSAGVWHGAVGGVLAVVMYDLCDYWLHRVSHESALFWAAHAVHHQSEHFNLSTALRQESLYGVMGWPFFLPMALLGVPTRLFALAGTVVLFYQFWIHTEHIGRLGWLDRVFSTPSNHRVHHAVNPAYLDRNYGAILVLWDRLFGSFAEEREPCVYGTVKPLASWNPLWGVGQFYAEMARRMRATPRWRDKLRVLYKSPGWLPPGVSAPRDDAAQRLMQPRFDPPGRPVARAGAVLLFLALGAVSGVWLMLADDLGMAANASLAVALAAGLWGVGALLQRRP
ncbi:sterol desaturase family protein [Roseateles cellulosilyticus]|uniref:Sterol desaturase family protein n=1 Tax=Pelomonas cellulosilytica TaxID=2906762 RepID=A0ABS8XWP2_9BURK|nr:sterol desaturase family protein [Pelomonas sp. P8]MCE4557081.1 sterol desaturase family protein [Pelomonas sp. P8]